jgi:hypothetical protein
MASTTPSDKTSKDDGQYPSQSSNPNTQASHTNRSDQRKTKTSKYWIVETADPQGGPFDQTEIVRAYTYEDVVYIKLVSFITPEKPCF